MNTSPNRVEVIITAQGTKSGTGCSKTNTGVMMMRGPQTFGHIEYLRESQSVIDTVLVHLI